MMRGSSGAQPGLTVGGVQAAYEVAANPEAFAERLLRLAGAVREAEKAKTGALAEQSAAREAMAAVEDGKAWIVKSEKVLADRDRHLSEREVTLAQDRARFEAEHKIKADALAINGSTAAAALMAILNGATVVYQGTVTGAATTTTLVDSGLTQAADDWWKGAHHHIHLGSDVASDRH